MDTEGGSEELNRILNEWKACQFVHNRGWVHSSLVPYDLNQCRRASCSSHVVDGGCVALDSNPEKCERAYGPSHVEDGGGDALQGSSEGMDRSSPDTDGPVHASSSVVGPESGPGLGLTDTCVAQGNPSHT
jgi:hypothetical protein